MSLKIVSIVGARPQFIKAAMVSQAILCHNDAVSGRRSAVGDQQSAINDQRATINEIMIHTGQHYDENMSQIFFDQMHIPLPKYNLRVGSGRHGATTGRMLADIESVLYDESPDWVLVYGDTNSTLAGALAAAKLHIPIAHVEAGLRSFNKHMPEEVNRVLTDHVARLLLCPTRAAVENLRLEGIIQGVVHMGDVMYDAALTFGELAEQQSTILADLGLAPKSYALATVHRAENTDDPKRLQEIVKALGEVASPAMNVVLPLHPRTRSCIDQQGIASLLAGNPCLRVIEPVSFLDMVQLEKCARVILTDSGGVQKEACFHGVPCVTLRDETEWVETVAAGWNTLAGADSAAIIKAVAGSRTGRPMPDYGSGHAAAAVVAGLIEFGA